VVHATIGQDWSATAGRSFLWSPPVRVVSIISRGVDGRHEIVVHGEPAARRRRAGEVERRSRVMGGRIDHTELQLLLLLLWPGMRPATRGAIPAPLMIRVSPANHLLSSGV